jgi:hypothetical protein
MLTLLEAESVRAAICASLREFASRPLTAAPPLDAHTDAVDARGAGAREGERADDAGDVAQVRERERERERERC